MICQSVRVKNFRNISEAEVCFSEGVNVLVGENAQGKSNLLEAIFYPSVGRSFRTSHMAELIQFGKSDAEITLSYRDDRREQNIRVKIFRDKQRQVEKNGLKIEKLSDLVGSFRTVLFFPEHLSMIRSGPAERRGYLDPAISRLYPRYIHSLQRYHYFLKQRNALIKGAYADRSAFDATIELWSLELAKEAAVLSAYRLAFIRRVSEHVARIFSEMTGEKECPSVHYKGSSGQSEEEYEDRKKTEEAYFSLLMASHDREIAAGATLWGIHKDDMEIEINGKSARIYASQGQQRSLALALKLAEGEITKEEFGDDPVLLLDDVLSELDGSRREYLVHKIKDKQVILTGCEPTLLSELDDVHRILVKNGSYFSFSKEK